MMEKKLRKPKEHLNIADSYKIYKEWSRKPMEKSEYLELANEFMKFISQELLETGEIILPLRLGKVQILGKKLKPKFEDGVIKGLAPDWVSTKKLWEEDEEAKKNKQLVYHFNEDTNGIRYRYYWNKTRVLVSNKALFILKMSRANKRALSKIVKEGKEYLIKN